MKTIASSIVGLGMIFLAITLSFSAPAGSNENGTSRKGFITYKVNVHLSTELSLCNTYVVIVRDGSGNMVASPQQYVPGVSEYTFTQPGPSAGKRIASLIMSQFGEDYVCKTQLFTSPAVRFGPFLNDLTYVFELYPHTQAH